MAQPLKGGWSSPTRASQPQYLAGFVVVAAGMATELADWRLRVAEPVVGRLALIRVMWD